MRHRLFAACSAATWLGLGVAGGCAQSASGPGACDAAEDAGSCSTEDAGRPGIVVQGAKYEGRGCFHPEAAAGVTTRDPSADCGDSVTYAFAPDGECWRFPNKCIPDDFRALSPLLAAGGCLDGGDYCTDLLQCPPDQVATPAGCRSCAQARQERADRLSNLVRFRGDRCTLDSDCTEQLLDSACDALCPLPVGKEYSYDFFQAQAAALVSDYCPDPQRWGETCGLADVVCVATAICRDNRCVIGDP